MSSEYIKSLEEENRALRKRVEYLENTLVEIESLTYRSKQYRVIPVEDIASDDQTCSKSNNCIQPHLLETIELNDDDDAPVATTSAHSDVLSYLQLRRCSSIQPIGKSSNVPVVSRAQRNAAATMKRENHCAHTIKMLKKCKPLRIRLDRLPKKNSSKLPKNTKPRTRSTATSTNHNNKNLKK